MTPIDRPTHLRPRLVVGTMTGTSIDGDLDAALVAVRGHGLAMRVELVAHRAHPLGALAVDLRRVASQEPLPAGELARIARAFGDAHGDAIAALCADPGAVVSARAAGGACSWDRVGPERVVPDLAVLHGQTVFHAPPLSWQLIDPWPVAVRLGCRVRFDLRGANLASGGQGAPITPLADYLLFADDDAPRLVLNLGGFVNATWVPRRQDGPSGIRGIDACACNHLLDRVARERLGTPFDAGGAAASRGRADESIVQAISRAIAPGRDPRAPRRSLGTGDEAARLVGLAAALAPDDACRTVVEGIADAVARVVRAETGAGAVGSTGLAAGGSARNQALLAALSERLGMEVRRTDEAVGIPVETREAAEIAILGALADDGVRYSLPQVTGTESAAPESAAIDAPAPGGRPCPEIARQGRL